MAKLHGHIEQRNGRFRLRLYRPALKRYESFTVRDKETAKQIARTKYREFEQEHEDQREQGYGVQSKMLMSQLVGKDDAPSRKARRLGQYDPDGPLGQYEREVVAFRVPGAQRAIQESLRL